MKKLTTGIFTVLLGLVAVDANAAVTSKAYVDAQVGGVDTKVNNLTTEVNNFTTNIGDTITNQIGDELTSADSEISKALATKADKTQVATDIAAAVKTETDRATAAEKVNSDAIGALTTRVGTNETDIDNLQTAVSGLTTGENSVKSQIDTALADYTNTEDMNTALNLKADKATTYTKTEVDTVVADAKKAGTDAATALTAYQTTNNAAVQKNATDITALQAADTAINTKIGTVAEGKTVVQMITEAQTAATYDDTKVKADIAANTNKIDAVETAYKAADKAITDSIGTVSAANMGTTATTVVGGIKEAVDEAAAAQATANAAIPAPTDECANPTNKCVLTYNNAAYAWEVIERQGGE